MKALVKRNQITEIATKMKTNYLATPSDSKLTILKSWHGPLFTMLMYD